MTKEYDKIKEVLRSGARRNFWIFCNYMDFEFFQSRQVLKDFCMALDEVAKGNIKRLSVSMPPRYGKSYVVSLYSAWILGVKPEGSVMRNTCTATLYNKFSYDTRDIVKSSKYSDVFHDLKLSNDKQAITGWNTSKSLQVGYFGAGVGGTIIGFGANAVAITDDLFRSYFDATSAQIIDKTINWYDGTHKSRLEKGCPEIDVGTRWTKKDVIGHNISREYYDTSVIIPALDKNGESTCDMVRTSEEYNQLKKETDVDIWSAEYMQTPIETRNNLFQSLNKYDKLDKEIDGKVAFIDTADTGADYLVLTIGYLEDANVNIEHIYMTKDDMQVTLPECARLLNEHQVNYCRVESNGAGRFFGAELRKHVTNTEILLAHESSNKHTKIIMHSPFIKNFVTFRNSLPEMYFNQLMGYSRIESANKGRHDDAIDSLIGLCIFVKGIFPDRYL